MSDDTKQRMIESASRVLARANAHGDTRLARIQRESIAVLQGLRGGPSAVFEAADVKSGWGARVRPGKAAGN